MGFFEKVKNMFTEEVEEDDVKVEQIKKEVTHVQIESPAAKEENFDDDLNERITFTSEKNDKPKPIFFDDNDFEDLKLTKHSRFDDLDREEEVSIKKENLYRGDTKVEDLSKEKKIFKPTPIISPVYGVLDKNYHKEDIVSREERKNQETSEISPIDSIRNKAYGTLEDELENTLFGSNSILFKKDEKTENKKEDKLEVKEVDDEVLTDLTDDISKELDELLVKKEKYIPNDEEKTLEDEDLLGFIDSTLYKDGEE